jgi:hypothetical protein
MAQTNSAFASGGMHHGSFECGFSSFFPSARQLVRELRELE